MDGGGVRIYDASPTIDGNVITDNAAWTGGGGVAITGGSPTIVNNQIVNNYQDGGSGGIGGGGIEVWVSERARIVHNTISDNSFGGDPGGGIALDSASPLIEDNLITENFGGGIFAYNYSAPAIIQNLITYNQGEGIGLSPALGKPGEALVVNNTIANNSWIGLSIGGAEHQVGLFNNIVVATSGEAAILCDTTYDPLSPVLAANNAYTGGVPALQGGCQGAIGSNGNISVDPRFVNLSGGDYHLRSDSPAIDAGDNQAPDLPSSDLDGNPRSNPLDPTVDQGAFEYQLPRVHLERSPGKPASVTVDNLARAEGHVAIRDGTPGIQNVSVVVNGTHFEVEGLRNGEVRTLDVSSAMIPGDANTMTFTALGQPGGSADVAIFR